MPCGGINPIAPLTEEISSDWHCISCNEWLDPEGKTPDHFCEEFDGVLHGGCVEEFLKSPEGLCVIAHNHRIQIYDDVLQEEGVNQEEDL